MSLYARQKRTPESDHEESADKPKLRDSPRNNWPVHVKNVNVMKQKERPRNCPGESWLERQDHCVLYVIQDLLL